MPPFKRDLASTFDPDATPWAIGTPCSKTSPNAQVDGQNIPSDVPLVSTSPLDEDLPPAQYIPTYAHRAVQTSPHLYFPDAARYPHLYPVSYGFNQYLNPHLLPWNVPSTSMLPVAPVHTSQGTMTMYSVAPQMGRQTSRTATGGFFAPVIPPGPYPVYARYPYPQPVPQHNFPDQPPREASPLIAPPPKYPIPPPECLPLASEPSSPTASAVSLHATSTTLTPSAILATRRALSTPPPHSTASPIENPSNTLYKSLRSVLLISEPDAHFLAREISGEQLVAVHGVGVWSVRGTAAAIETTKQSAFKMHASHAAWLFAARARTAHYAAPGAVRPPLRWVLVERGAALPADALQTGTEAGGERLYSARAWWAGGLHLGKAAAHLRRGGASISHGSLEHALATFEVLVGDQQYAMWVDVPPGAILAFPHTSPSAESVASDLHARLGPDADALPASFVPVEGGREADGEALLIAQGAHERGWHPGKARLGDDHCCVAYGGGELWVKGFRVLGYSM